MEVLKVDKGTPNITQYLKKNRFKSIFFMSLIRISLIILLPLIIVVWVASFSFNAFTDKEILVYSNKSLAMILNTTHNMFADNLKQMNYLSTNINTSMFLISDPSEKITFYDRNDIFKLITVQMQTKDYIESIYIYSEINNLLISNIGLTEFEMFSDTDWYLENQFTQPVGQFSYLFRTVHKSNQNPVPTLSFCKTVGYLNERQGVMVFNINFRKFANELASMKSSYDYGLYIADNDLNIITDVWGGHEDIPYESFSKLHSSPNDYIKDGDFVLYKAPIRYTDWYYVSAVPYEIYQSNINELWKDMFLVIGFGFLITVLITILISIWISQPYKRIVKVIQQPVSLMENKQPINHNEESYILNTIKNTMSKNVQITQQLRERVEMLKKAQRIALQSQINPHFLYNTLDTINWSSMRLTGGKNETSIMISKLSSMLRYSLEDVETLVTLKNELDNTKTYLELQEMRYKSKFSVNWNIDDNVLQCKVIKIMLQPIIENALYHGLRPLSGQGMINIESKKQEEKLVIIVKDSGVGMDPQTVNEINKKMQSKHIQEKEHIGIMNVNQRIQLFFGEQYGVLVESDHNLGTTITLNLPYEIG